MDTWKVRSAVCIEYSRVEYSKEGYISLYCCTEYIRVEYRKVEYHLLFVLSTVQEYSRVQYGSTVEWSEIK